MFFFKLVSNLPFVILYFIADTLYILLYYIIGYRKKVVFQNIRNAFPEKSNQEIKRIAKGFYKNLADIIVETIKGLTISEQEIKRRVRPVNIEEMDKYYDKNQSVMAMVSHMCNWEWVGLACSTYLRTENDMIYQKIKSPAVNELMKLIRTRFGAVLIEKKAVLRELVRRKQVVKAVGSLADQSPKKGENRLWVNFLNQETAFFNGSEKIARKFNMAVFYISMKRIKRGFYQIEFFFIDEPPFNEKDNYVTRIFTKKLEKSIRSHPSDWLWSHKRWKLNK